MIDNVAARLRHLLINAWLGITFVIGLLPIAAMRHRAFGGNSARPELEADSYWRRRESSTKGFDIWSNDDMIVVIDRGQRSGSYLRGTTSPSGARRVLVALCLGMLRPISRLVPQDEETDLDPSIYTMY